MPYRLELIQEQVKKIDTISTSVAELKTSKEYLDKMATSAEQNVGTLRTEAKNFLVTHEAQLVSQWG